MRFVRNLPWIISGLFLILHGFAHSPAILGSWNLVSLDDVTRQPNFLLTNAGDAMLYVLGTIWFLAALSFVIAGIGVLRQSAWWPMMMALALVLSVPMTMLWREDAFIGLIINGVLLAIMGSWYLLGIREERQFA